MNADFNLPTHEAAAAFAALGSEQRLDIVTTLVRAGPDGLTTGALGEKAGVAGSTLTHHLKILCAAGLIQQQKSGRMIRCTAARFEQIESLSRYLLEACCADAAEVESSRNKRYG